MSSININKPKESNLEQYVNPDRLSENHKQMFDLISHVIHKAYEIMYDNATNITKKDLIGCVFNDTIKRYKINSKKRNRRVIDKNKMCMGRKLDTLQCTRKRLEGQDYCLSHVKNRPNGRIDQEMVIKSKGKRGRSVRITLTLNKMMKLILLCGKLL